MVCPHVASLTDGSLGALGSAGDVNYRNQQTPNRRIFDPHCLDWAKVAYRIYDSK